jgi:diguanylate cyclase (GGDEF)-like protein/PAS domain S-box-containing protein
VVNQQQLSSLKRDALKIAAIYAVCGFLWLLFADELIVALMPAYLSPYEARFYQDAIYILATACLVYLLVWSHVSRISRFQRHSPVDSVESIPSRDAGKLKSLALRIAAVYAGAGVLWVWFSEPLLRIWFEDAHYQGWLAESKHSIFVLLSACIVYYLIKIYVDRVKEMERALDQTEVRLRQIIDLVPHMIFAKDWQGRYVLCNQAFAEAHGSTVEELIGSTESGLDGEPKNANNSLTAEENLVVRSGRNAPHRQEDFIDAEGERRVLQTTRIPFRDFTSNRPAVLGISLDVTERVNTQQELFEQKERAQVTLNSITDAVITTDVDGIVDYMNPAAEALTGCSIEDARGRILGDVFEVVDPKGQKRAANPLAWALEEGLAIGLLDRNELVSRSGRKYAIQDSAAPIRDEQGNVLGLVIVFRDVTESRRMAQRMFYLATHDPLTGLANRREFERRLALAVEDARRHENQHFLCYLDLDQFKIVNDTAGHAAGDQLLKELTTKLSRRVRPRDVLARLGGDEFSLLIENSDLAKATQIAESLVAEIRDFRFSWSERQFEITVSVGLVPINAATEDGTEVLTQGDVACYTAKDLGRNRVHVYTKDDQEFTRRHTEILRAAGLSEALTQKRFLLYGQPVFQVNGAGYTPVFVEVLLRLYDETGKVTMPHSFIPAAERYGIMSTIDRWVIEATLTHLKTLRFDPGIGIAVNLSGSSLKDENFLSFVREHVGRSGFPNERLCFEITETAAVGNMERAVHFISEIRKIGCRFALDDFGSGLSSFNYLKHMPVDYLKIDGNFVRNMAADSVDHAMVAAIKQVGNIMGIKVIAECADTADVVSKLREIGVDLVQGWHLCQPQPLDAVLQQFSGPVMLNKASLH